MRVAVGGVVRLIVVFAALAAAGCGMGLHDTRLERLDVAAARALAGRRMDVDLIGAPGLGAWAWAGGRGRVTPALVDVLDADELAAVLAHEQAHLRADEERAAPAAVGGNPYDVDAEIRADAAGCMILRARGLPPEAMPRMLEKLAHG